MNPEKRIPLTRIQFAKLALKQQGKCGCCGKKLDFDKARQIVDEHLVGLASMGSNDLDNRALWCVPCAKAKTSREAPALAKVRRMNGSKSSQVSRRKKRKAEAGAKDQPKASMPSRPFATNKDSKFKKTMDGRVVMR